MKPHSTSSSTTEGELPSTGGFYVEALVKESDLKRVFDQAKTKMSAQFTKAEEIADSMALSPPKTDAKPDLFKYIRDNVLVEIPNKLQYDDTFWSCLLYLLASKDVPLCSIGGPFHKMIYRVYDDFDPNDVS